MGAFDDLIPSGTGAGGAKPKLAPGYAMGANGVAAPIPGTPSAEKQRLSSLARDETVRGQKNVLQTIDRALPLVRDVGGSDLFNWPTAGMLHGVAGMIPGTDAYNLQRSLDTVKANVGFDRLQAMRNSSPTGGALGQVSDTENKLLQSTIASFDTGQDAKTLRQNLKRVAEEYRAKLGQPAGILSRSPPPAAKSPKVIRFEDLP